MYDDQYRKLCQHYIRKLVSDSGLSGDDRQLIADLLRLVIVKDKPILPKRKVTAPSWEDNDVVDTLAYEELRKTMSHSDAMKKHFGHMRNAATVITSGRKKIKVLNMSNEDELEELVSNALLSLPMYFND